MNPWIDISLSIDGCMAPWPGDVGYRRVVQREAGVQVSDIHLSAHYGTHMDGQNHYFAGQPGVDALPLDCCVGPAYLLDLRGMGRVELGESAFAGKIPAGVQRLLIRTDNEGVVYGKEFCADFAALSLDGAQFLLQMGVRLIGIDALSVGSVCGGDMVHRCLLASSEVVVLEGITLKHLAQGWYDLVALPLRLYGADGAPARAIVRRRNE